jgi:predicted TPR repeat methyltransferase
MQIDERLQQGISAHRSGNLEAALSAYKDVLSEDPDHADGLHFLGLLHFDAGKADNAVALIHASLERNPGNFSAWNNLGNILKLSGDKDEALKAYLRAVEIEVRHEEAWKNISMMLQEASNNDELLPMLREVVRLDPNNHSGWHNFGISLMLAGKREEAADAFERCLQFPPDVWSDKGWHPRVLCALGRAEVATRHMEMLVATYPDDPVIRYQFAAIRGEDLSLAPADYVRDHFDSFSESFDDVLNGLGYQAPKLVAEEVAELARERDLPFAHVVDLGCGTGLCGPLIRDHCARLTGIDLSPGMLRKAAALKVYDFLVEGELVGFLSSDLPAQFDLAVCVDTLCYLGDLEPFMRALAEALAPGGMLVASVEHLDTSDGPDYRVDATGRYAHRPEYLKRCAEAAGLLYAREKRDILRKELGKDVQGLVFHIRKPGASQT